MFFNVGNSKSINIFDVQTYSNSKLSIIGFIFFIYPDITTKSSYFQYGVSVVKFVQFCSERRHPVGHGKHVEGLGWTCPSDAVCV